MLIGQSIMTNRVLGYFRPVWVEKYLQVLNAITLQLNKEHQRLCPESTGQTTDTYAESKKSSQTKESNSVLADELLKDKHNTILKRSYNNKTSNTFCAEVKQFHKATAKSRTMDFSRITKREHRKCFKTFNEFVDWYNLPTTPEDWA